MKTIVGLIPLLFLFFVSNAQEFENVNPARAQIHERPAEQLSLNERTEDTLVFLADSMYYSALDESRISGNEEFIRVLKRFFRNEHSFEHPLKKLKTKIVVLESPDRQFRILNWEIMRNLVEHRYYGVIQQADGKLFPMVDMSDQVIRGLEDSVFTATRWYGNLFYQILKKENGNENLYFLLGWNGNSLNSHKKIMDVLYFDAKGNPVFGKPVFQVLDRGRKKTCMRLVVEYEKGSRVALNYDTDNGKIVFDHCESQIGDPAKKYTYVPDGTYDGLSWDGHQWVMQENVIAITILKDGEAPRQGK